MYPFSKEIYPLDFVVLNIVTASFLHFIIIIPPPPENPPIESVTCSNIGAFLTHFFLS